MAWRSDPSAARARDVWANAAAETRVRSKNVRRFRGEDIRVLYQILAAGIDSIGHLLGLRKMRLSGSRKAFYGPSTTVWPKSHRSSATNKFLLGPSGRDYVISRITTEWSDIPASRSTCEYRQDVMRGVSEGVAKA